MERIYSPQITKIETNAYLDCKEYLIYSQRYEKNTLYHIINITIEIYAEEVIEIFCCLLYDKNNEI